MQTQSEIKISKRSFKAALKDAAQTAKAVNLVYVSNSDPGYTRRRRGKSFYYTDGNKKISDPKTIERIRKLVIPPAWENVWICKQENGHLQVTGTDGKSDKIDPFVPVESAPFVPDQLDPSCRFKLTPV